MFGSFNPFPSPGGDIHALLSVTAMGMKGLRAAVSYLTSDDIDTAVTAQMTLSRRANTYIDIRKNMLYRLNDQTNAKVSKNFKLQDIKFCESIGRNLQSFNIDILKIQQFQPQMRLFMMGILISIIEQVLGLGQYNENALGGVIKTVLKGVMAIMVPTLKATGLYLNNDYAYDNALNNWQLTQLVNPSRVQNMTELKMLFGSPIEQYAAYFSDGKWLNTYQIPFFNSKEFLYLPDCKNRQKWSASDPFQALFGKTIGDFLKDRN